MSIHLHRTDETGTWNCQGPFPSMDAALGEAHRILQVKKRLGEKWSKVDAPYPYKHQWKNKQGHTMSIKED